MSAVGMPPRSLARVAAQARTLSRSRDHAGRGADALAAERAAILNQLSEGVVVVDVEGRIVLVNEAARRLHGVSGLGLPVGGYSDACHLLTLDGLPHPLSELPLARAVLRGETVERARWRIMRPDGTEIVAEGSASPVILADGTRYGSVLTLRDVTDQIALDRHKDEFLGSVSHDLKNPLTLIRGTAQLLRRQLDRITPPSASDVRSSLAAIDAAAMLMADQLDTVLDVARSRMGRPLDLILRRTELVAIARQLVDEQQRATDLHHVTLTASSAEVVGTWDGSRLRRALRNLLVNAIAYSPLGGDVTVAIAIAGEEAVVSVRDSGLGIPASDLPLIFERFHRGANVTNQFAGTGIGLADVRDVVHQHSGSVGAESQEGQGSLFTIRLPLFTPTISAGVA